MRDYHEGVFLNSSIGRVDGSSRGCVDYREGVLM